MKSCSFPISPYFLQEKRNIKSPTPNRQMEFYNFNIITGNEKKEISWSSGMGCIAPATFNIHKHTFWLELAASRDLGWLKGNELVITKKD